MGLGLIIALNWQIVVFGIAVASSESRPALLEGAGWNDPGSAVRFNQRFAKGTAERDLIAWLHDNRFAVDPHNKRAERLIESLPCNERVEINWSAPFGDTLKDASATVHEAGCL